MKIRTEVIATLEEAMEEIIELAAGIEVVRRTVVRHQDGSPKTTEVTEKVRHSRVSEDKYYGQFVVVSPILLERLRLKGWFPDPDDWKLVSPKPFTHVVSGEPFEVIRLDHSNHRLFDVESRRIPVALYFDYMTSAGRVNDYYFDLKALVKHLKTREDVRVVNGRWGDKEIQSVDHYNAGGTCGHQFVSFMWTPSAEVFREYVGKIIGVREPWDQRDIAHTMLGNDPFRVAPRIEDNDRDKDEEE